MGLISLIFWCHDVSRQRLRLRAATGITDNIILAFARDLMLNPDPQSRWLLFPIIKRDSLDHLFNSVYHNFVGQTLKEQQNAQLSVFGIQSTLATYYSFIRSCRVSHATRVDRVSSRLVCFTRNWKVKNNLSGVNQVCGFAEQEAFVNLISYKCCRSQHLQKYILFWLFLSYAAEITF